MKQVFSRASFSSVFTAASPALEVCKPGNLFPIVITGNALAEKTDRFPHLPADEGDYKGIFKVSL